MSNTDAWFGPLKAGCQAVCGQWDEAKKSMRNFKESNPLVLGTRGVYHTCRGNTEKGTRLMKDGGKGTVKLVNGVVNAIPVVGHAKGVVHYACGDKEGGHKTMKSSSRTTGGGATIIPYHTMPSWLEYLLSASRLLDAVR